MDIKTRIINSSDVEHDINLKSGERVMSICKSLKATDYINPIGGIELYNKDNFRNSGLELHFLKAKNINYKQFENEFIPYLSIIDLLFFIPHEEIIKIVNTDFEIL